MGNNHSMWKKLIGQTVGKREEKIREDDDVVFVDFEVERKGIIRTLIDDHRDVAMYKRGILVLYLKIRGDYEGRTLKFDGLCEEFRHLFREVSSLMARNKELEARIKEYEEKGVCLR